MQKEYNIPELVKKFEPVLELVKDKNHHSNISLLFEISLNYLSEQYSEIKLITKISCMYIIRKLYLKGSVTSDTDVIKVINDYVSYYDLEYTNFVAEYHENIEEHELNMYFIKKYINSLS